MTDVTTVDAEIVEENDVPTTALTVRENGSPARLNAQEVSSWTPRIQMTVDDAVEMVAERDRFMKQVMRKDLDYGVIPGTGTKPTLLKPGAERLLTTYGLHPQLSDAEPPVMDWSGADHGGEPFFFYRRVCRIYRQTGPREDDRMLIAQAEGVCHSFEKKYRWREGSTTLCPECNQAGIRFVANADYIPGGKGWYHAKGGGGCGAKIAAETLKAKALDAQRAEGVTRVPNPDVADQINTILKMADKRALVAATIIATGWSDIVTQDVEDFVPSTAPTPAAEPESHEQQGRAAGKAATAAPAAPQPAATGEWTFGGMCPVPGCGGRVGGTRTAMVCSGPAKHQPDGTTASSPRDDGDINPDDIPF